MVYETDFYTTRRPYSRPTISSYSVTQHYMRPYLSLNKQTWQMNYVKDFPVNPYVTSRKIIKKQNPYLVKEDSDHEEGMDRERSRLTLRKIKRLRQKVRDGAAKCEMLAQRNHSSKYVQVKMPKIKVEFFDSPLRVIPGITRSYYTSYSPYSPNLYYHYIPHYSSYYGTPGSIFLPSAVPLRYYSRSTPVRVITSPLRDYSPPRIFSVHVRPSVIHRELLRIEHKPRQRYGVDAVEEYLNSSSAKEFEDDIRNIRTHSSRILQRIHAPLPRARRAVSCVPFSRYGYDPAERDFYDNIRGRSIVPDDIFTLANYAEPAKRYTGKTHLASVRICGNLGYPIRKSAVYTDDIYDPVKVHNEIEYLSHYLKNRRAAAEREGKPEKLESDRILDPFRASRKFNEMPKPIDEHYFEKKEKHHDRQKRSTGGLGALSEVDELELEKIKAKRLHEQKLQEQKYAEEEKLRKEAEAQKIEAAKKEAARKLEEERKQAELEERRAAQEAEKLEQEKLRAAAEKKAAEEKAKLEAEKKAAEQKARIEAEKKAAAEAARLEAEKKAAEEAARLAAEKKAAEEAARLEAELKAAEEAAKLEKERLEKEEEERRLAAEKAAKLEEEAARLQEEALKLAEIEKAAKEEREAELARQAGELAEIARLEVDAIKLEQLEKEAEALGSPLENASPVPPVEENEIVSEPVVEEPLTPAAAEDTKADISEGNATADDAIQVTEVGHDTGDEADPLE